MPGIRAMRNVRKEEGRQHQNAAMDGRPTGAQARGVAAMRQMDGNAGMSAGYGSSGDFEVAPHATMEGLDPYHVNVKVDVTVELSTGEGSREGQQPVKPQPMGQRVPEVRSATGQKPSGSQGDSTGPEPSHEVEEVWRQERFEKPERRSTDCWDLTYIDKGWLLRLHRKPRKRFFHPVHGSLPIDPEQLTSERTTIRFGLDGRHRVVAHDDWRGKVRTDDGSSWCGYTFFRLEASKVATTASGSTKPTMAPLEIVKEETDSSESCGSYEMITP